MKAKYKVRKLNPIELVEIKDGQKDFLMEDGSTISPENLRKEYTIEVVEEEDTYAYAWRRNHSICPVYECPHCHERTSTFTASKEDLDEPRKCENCGLEYMPNNAELKRTNLIGNWGWLFNDEKISQE